MINKRYYKKNAGFSYILDEMGKRFGKECSDAILSDAVKFSNELCEKYKNLSKKEKAHTEQKIFPRIALYVQMLKFISRDEALVMMKEAVGIAAEPYGKMIHNATKVPFIRHSFFKIFYKMLTKGYNEEAGFKFGKVERDKKHYRVDIIQCPYMKYCELLGCKELTSTFCFSDECVYGNMSGIVFERKGTLGRGSDKCDFYFYESNNV